jgi:hypothetical protein
VIRGVTATATAFLAAVTVVISAAPAHADDTTYIRELDALGVSYLDNKAALEMGYSSCWDFRAGIDFFSEVDYYLRRSLYDATTAGAIITTALHNLCPDQFEKVKRQASGHI